MGRTRLVSWIDGAERGWGLGLGVVWKGKARQGKAKRGRACMRCLTRLAAEGDHEGVFSRREAKILRRE